MMQTTQSPARHALTDAQAAQFERDGFVVARGLFSPEEAASIRAAFMAEAANGPVPGLSEMTRGVVGYAPSDPLAFYPRMMNPHAHLDKEVGQIARAFLLEARLRPLLTEMLGDEPLAVQSMFYFKSPGARGQDLHQDNFYLRVKPGTCLAAWIAVDDVDAGNGGMMAVPGSHHLEIACPQVSDPTLFFSTEHVPVPDGMEARQIDMKPGDVLFFNGSVIHGSLPNTSTDRFRRSLIFHYAPRHAQELSPWYKTPMTFDGEIVPIAEAQGGGPCGTPQEAMGAH